MNYNLSLKSLVAVRANLDFIIMLIFGNQNQRTTVRTEKHVLKHKLENPVTKHPYRKLLMPIGVLSSYLYVICLITRGQHSIKYMTGFPTPVTIKRISRPIQENSF